MFDDIYDVRLAALNELLYTSTKIRLEFPRELYNVNKSNIDSLKEDMGLDVKVFSNFDNVTVEVELKE